MASFLGRILASICISTSSLFAFEWEKISPLPTDADLSFVVNGGGMFVAAGQSALTYSRDSGNNWTTVTEGAGVTFTGLAYGGNRFVATMNTGSARVSDTEGKIWSTNSVAAAPLSSVAFGNGLFVVGTASGLIATSPNGGTWTPYPGISSGDLAVAAYGNGFYLLVERVAQSNTLYAVRSTSGQAWTRIAFAGITPGISGGGRFPPYAGLSSISALTFGRGKFVAEVQYFNSITFFSGSKLFTSVDGENWTEAVNPGAGIAFDNGLFYSSSSLATVYTSTDLTNWVTHSVPAPARGIATGPLSSVAVGPSAAIMNGSSIDTLKRVDNPEKGFFFLWGMSAAGQNIALAGGQLDSTGANTYATVLISTNGGKHFVKAQFPPGSPKYPFTDVQFGDDLWVVVGDGIYNSADAFTWSPSANPSIATKDNIAYADGIWRVVSGADILSSTNGVNFEIYHTSSPIVLNGIAGGDGKWIAVGTSGAFYRLSGNTWIPSGTDEGTDLNAITYGDGKFVAVGENGRVYISTDGVAWIPKRAIGARSLTSVAYAGGYFVAIEENTQRSYFSSDGGLTWAFATMPYEGATFWAVESDNSTVYSAGLTEKRFHIVYRAKLAADLAISANVTVDRHLKLSITAPSGGSYQIYSTTDPSTPSWISRGVFILTQGSNEWIEPSSLTEQMYYQVRREP